MKYRHNLFYTAAFLIVLMASLPLASAYTLNYDANGNLITGDGKFRIYDGFNHLVQVRNGSDSSGLIMENYTWHPMEDRILVKAVYETNGSWKENVYYFSKEFVRVKNATGKFDYKYIYQNGQLVAQQNPDGSKLFFHNDHLGSVGLVTNESGAKVEETMYAPFGEIISGGESSRYDYTGKEFDSVVGDYDFNARKYSPQKIIMDTPDNNIPEIYNPQSLNRYSYVKNNPYKYTDPTGNYAEDVHMDLTRSLAISAGFSILEAGTIAMADQTVDETLTHPWILYAVDKIAKTEFNSKYHFERQSEAQMKMDDAIRTGKLNNIGKTLHIYQDTFSHEGLTPDTHKQIGFAPDITSNNILKSDFMAFRTLQYLGSANGMSAAQIVKTWNNICSDVNQFSKATNSKEKNDALRSITTGGTGTLNSNNGRRISSYEYTRINTRGGYTWSEKITWTK